MRFLSVLLEAITSPFSIVLRNSGGNKNFLSWFTKSVVIFLVSLIIVTLIVLFWYRDQIFG